MTDRPEPIRKLERFEDLARRLLSVPKRDVDAAREEEKEETRRKRDPKAT